MCGSREEALQQAALCARDIGTALSRHCPVYFYGAAHPSGRALADVRRSLGERGWGQGIW